MGGRFPYRITVLHATQHGWMHSASTLAKQPVFDLRTGGTERWVDLGGLCKYEMVTHPSTNRAQCRVTYIDWDQHVTTKPNRHLNVCHLCYDILEHVLWHIWNMYLFTRFNGIFQVSPG